MDYQPILEEIRNEVDDCLQQGILASCIPEPARVPPHQFGTAV